MVNPFARVNWSPSRGELRVFAGTVGIGAPIVAAAVVGISYLRKGTLPLEAAAWVAAAGWAIATASVLSTTLGRWLYRAWYVLGCSMGLITANVALMAVFFLVVTPLGLARRMVGRARFLRAPETSVQSYWTPAPPPPGRRSYSRQF